MRAPGMLTLALIILAVGAVFGATEVAVTASGSEARAPARCSACGASAR